MRWDPGPGKHAARQEWVLDTDGNNMFDVMMLDEIDRTRIKSNDVVEILQVSPRVRKRAVDNFSSVNNV